MASNSPMVPTPTMPGAQQQELMYRGAAMACLRRCKQANGHLKTYSGRYLLDNGVEIFVNVCFNKEDIYIKVPPAPVPSHKHPATEVSSLYFRIYRYHSSVSPGSYGTNEGNEYFVIMPSLLVVGKTYPLLTWHTTGADNTPADIVWVGDGSPPVCMGLLGNALNFCGMPSYLSSPNEFKTPNQFVLLDENTLIGWRLHNRYWFDSAYAENGSFTSAYYDNQLYLVAASGGVAALAIPCPTYSRVVSCGVHQASGGYRFILLQVIQARPGLAEQYTFVYALITDEFPQDISQNSWLECTIDWGGITNRARISHFMFDSSGTKAVGIIGYDESAMLYVFDGRQPPYSTRTIDHFYASPVPTSQTIAEAVFTYDASAARMVCNISLSAISTGVVVSDEQNAAYRVIIGVDYVDGVLVYATRHYEGTQTPAGTVDLDLSSLEPYNITQITTRHHYITFSNKPSVQLTLHRSTANTTYTAVLTTESPIAPGSLLAFISQNGTKQVEVGSISYLDIRCGIPVGGHRAYTSNNEYHKQRVDQYMEQYIELSPEDGYYEHWWMVRVPNISASNLTAEAVCYYNHRSYDSTPLVRMPYKVTQVPDGYGGEYSVLSNNPLLYIGGEYTNAGLEYEYLGMGTLANYRDIPAFEVMSSGQLATRPAGGISTFVYLPFKNPISVHSTVLTASYAGEDGVSYPVSPGTCRCYDTRDGDGKQLNQVCATVVDTYNESGGVIDRQIFDYFVVPFVPII